MEKFEYRTPVHENLRNFYFFTVFQNFQVDQGWIIIYDSSKIYPCFIAPNTENHSFIILHTIQSRKKKS